MALIACRICPAKVNGKFQLTRHLWDAHSRQEISSAYPLSIGGQAQEADRRREAAKRSA